MPRSSTAAVNSAFDMTPMAEGDAPAAIGSEVSGTSGRVPAGRIGAEALVASGGVVEVDSEVDIGTENADTRLIGNGPLCLVDRRL